MDISKDNIEPLAGRVMVEMDAPEDKIGGIIIPEKYKVHGWNGKVLKVGDGVDCVAVGDEIMVMKSYTMMMNPKEHTAITHSEFIMAKIVLENEKYIIYPLNRFLLVRPDESKKMVGDIELPTAKPARSGIVVRKADAVEEAKQGDRVYFPLKTAIICQESGEVFNLIYETDIELVIDYA
jgi:co-chaperonin GroES (HSP10)